jgi:hypothetical protein
MGLELNYRVLRNAVRVVPQLEVTSSRHASSRPVTTFNAGYPVNQRGDVDQEWARYL